HLSGEGGREDVGCRACVPFRTALAFNAYGSAVVVDDGPCRRRLVIAEPATARIGQDHQEHLVQFHYVITTHVNGDCLRQRAALHELNCRQWQGGVILAGNGAARHIYCLHIDGGGVDIGGARDSKGHHCRTTVSLFNGRVAYEELVV